MNLWDLTLAEFSDRTASAAPTPGGGSVACVAAVLGVDLVSMALAITAKSAPSSEVTDTLATLRELADRLRACADADVACFDAFMAALAMPKQTDSEKSLRKTAIAEASLEAAEVPLVAATFMVSALEIAQRADALAKASVASDVTAGRDLLAGAIRAVLRNVAVNLPTIPSADDRQRLERERGALLARTAAHYKS
ncbi:MAG: cyclodeaminase/cyclohydrolase family protein [Polyangiaceae bacterium]